MKYYVEYTDIETGKNASKDFENFDDASDFAQEQRDIWSDGSVLGDYTQEEAEDAYNDIMIVER
jgi:hypothetical protein